MGGCRGESLSTLTMASSLPHDLHLDILLCLPVKSLLRFMSVSRSWHSLISHPNFVKRHLALSKGEAARDFDRKRLLLCRRADFYSFLSCSLRSLRLNDIVHLDPLSHQLQPFEHHRPEYTRLSVVGSDNGLVCLALGFSGFILWNPSTRESKYLDCAGSFPGFGVGFGFGYAASVDDYKLACIYRDRSTHDHPTRTCARVRVFSLKANSWRQIQDLPVGAQDIVLRGAQLVNGALHWLTKDYTVVALDLGADTYRMITLPEIPQPNYFPELHVSRGCLSVSCYVERCMAMWVMKKYGVKDSWFRLPTYEIECYHPTYYFNNFSDEEGEVLLRALSSSRYNPAELIPSLYGVIQRDYVSVIYPESLVSVNSSSMIGEPTYKFH